MGDCLGTALNNAWGWLGTWGHCSTLGDMLGWGWRGVAPCLLCTQSAVRGCWGQRLGLCPLCPHPRQHCRSLCTEG